MALLLVSGLASQSFVIPAPVLAPVRATFPTMQYGQPPQEPPKPYGQPSIAGLTIEQVRENAKKAASKRPMYDPKCKADGKANKNVVTGGWNTLK